MQKLFIWLIFIYYYLLKGKSRYVPQILLSYSPRKIIVEQHLALWVDHSAVPYNSHTPRFSPHIFFLYSCFGEEALKWKQKSLQIGAKLFLSLHMSENKTYYLRKILWPGSGEYIKKVDLFDKKSLNLKLIIICFNHN